MTLNSLISSDDDLDSEVPDHDCMANLGDLIQNDQGYSYECRVCKQLISAGKQPDD
jgi:hypothetical protein